MVRKAGICLALVASACMAAARAAPHTVRELVSGTLVTDLAISPDGKRIAVAQNVADKDFDVIAVLDADRLGEPGAARVVPLDEDGQTKIDWVAWATGTRLLVGVTAKTHTEMRHKGTAEGAWAALFRTRRVIAMDHDGSNPVVLFSGARRMLRYSTNLARIVAYDPEDPDHVLMPAWSGSTYDLYSVNVQTGAARKIERGGMNTFHWEAEQGRPVLRFDSNRRGSVITVFGRPDGGKDWSVLVRYREKQDRREMAEWQFAGDAPGAGKIYVRTRRDGADTAGIHLYDVATKTFGELVAEIPGYDLGRAVTIHGQYVGATYFADRLAYLLTDATLQRHLEGLDRYFAGEANVLLVGSDRARSRLLIHAEGPRAPSEYYLYDVATARLTALVAGRPWLDSKRLAGVEVRKVRTRDGATITAYLTRLDPTVTEPRPLVVMPHGGPEVRDVVDFDFVAQAFAAQGWMVLQPNFRGSAGYGRAFAEAGHRQWARRMQDDVTDAVRDLIDAKLADPERIAIYGSSYGGYAALIGAVVTPDLYRAAVSVAGVSDLGAMLEYVRREDGADSESYQYWVRHIGDPKADRAAIDAVSPRLRAAEIRIPVLLMHGTADEIVPAKQSELMKAALEKAGKSVKYVPFEHEDHPYFTTYNEERQIKAAIAFLAPVLNR